MIPTPKILLFGLITLSVKIYHPVEAADCSKLYAKQVNALLPEKTQVPAVAYDGDDVIYIFGGCRWNLPSPAIYSDQILKYTISTDTIELVALFPYGGVYMGTVVGDGLGNYFYFGGVSYWGNSAYVYKFDSYSYQVTIVNRIHYDLHYSASFAFDQWTAFIMAGNLFQDGIIKFDMQTYDWTRLADLPTKFSQAAAFWDKAGDRAYIFGKGNAAVNPPYDRVIYNPGSDYSFLANIDVPTNYLNVHSATNDQHYGFIVGGLEQTDSIFWYQLQTDVGKYCLVFGLPGGGDLLFSRTGAFLVPKLKRVYVFGGASQDLVSFLETTHDGIWYIDVDL